MPAEVLKRKAHIDRVRMRIIMDIETPKKDRAKFNQRVINMADKFIQASGEDIVLLTTEVLEELEKKP